MLSYFGTSLTHFDQFYNLTVNEVLESFLIGVVSTSFSIRQMMVTMNTEPSKAQIVGMYTNIIKQIIFFDSVYPLIEKPKPDKDTT